MLRSLRPYLFRAWYDWILDNQLTPYILVDSGYKNVVVPESYIKDGEIVLNITPTVVQQLEIHKKHLQFYARFSGAKHNIFIPLRAIKSIYAKENYMGIKFDKDIDLDEQDDGDGGDDHTPSPSPKKPSSDNAKSPSKEKKSHLKVVK